MPKLATSLPLSLSAPSPGTPLYRWFYEEFALRHLERRIAPGARLPATRDLAWEYKLARATVVTAFEQLKSEGYVEGKVGAGRMSGRFFLRICYRWPAAALGEAPGLVACGGRPTPVA